jgi:hypothetical protein
VPHELHSERDAGKARLVKRFEYYVADSDDGVALNDLGADGWELVTVLREEFVNARKGYTDSRIIYYLKRPVSRWSRLMKGSA